MSKLFLAQKNCKNIKYWKFIVSHFGRLLFKVENTILVPMPPKSTLRLDHASMLSLALESTITTNLNAEQLRTNFLLKRKNFNMAKHLPLKEREKITMDLLSPFANCKKVNKILLVDDIFTTGNTISAAIKAIRRTGYNGSFEVYTVARRVLDNSTT